MHTRPDRPPPGGRDPGHGRHEPAGTRDAGDSADLRTTAAAAAVVGAISPSGGPNGYALGLMIEALVATRTRTALGDDVHRTLDPTHPSTKGDVFIAMEPTATGHGRVRAPDACACATRAANPADAVPVSQVTWTPAQQIAADVPERH
ncbi:Ldh family oxidoreductase [Micromonospora pisi]|uniref:Ldh family oxidoreductase n=1 Tax=Micromonospora pisi TaxID=589240 RepID=UPI001476B3D7|nr:Ldh family oxidoreductase [Micromonospora pisi]